MRGKKIEEEGIVGVGNVDAERRRLPVAVQTEDRTGRQEDAAVEGLPRKFHIVDAGAKRAPEIIAAISLAKPDIPIRSRLSIASCAARFTRSRRRFR